MKKPLTSIFASLAGQPMIAYAIKGCQRTFAKMQLGVRGIDLEKRDMLERTALHDAVMVSSEADNLALLLVVGADVNAVDAHGLTPLQACVRYSLHNEKVQMCRALIAAGADVDTATKDSRHVLHDVVGSSDEGMCRLFLEAGAKVDTPWVVATFDSFEKNDNAFAKTPLHLAVEQGLVNLCRLLVKHGANPSWMNADNNNARFLTPFQYAVNLGRDEVVRFFVEECGESLSQRTVNGRSLMDLTHDGSMVRAYLLSLETEALVGEALDVCAGHEAGGGGARRFSASPL